MNIKVTFFLVFIFCANTIFSQENTHSASDIKLGNITELPFMNYKGIKDLDEAKKEWLIDHLELNLKEKNQDSTKISEISMTLGNTEVEQQKQSDDVVKTENVYENQPYLNYKGIKNPKEARKIWILENPEAARKLNEKLHQSGTTENSSTKDIH